MGLWTLIITMEMKCKVKINCKSPASSWPIINSSFGKGRCDRCCIWTIFKTGLIFMLKHSSQPCQQCQTPPCFLIGGLTKSTSWFTITNWQHRLKKMHIWKHGGSIISANTGVEFLMRQFSGYHKVNCWISWGRSTCNIKEKCFLNASTNSSQ